jgi:hypothetical protein
MLREAGFSKAAALFICGANYGYFGLNNIIKAVK